jgi:hypothetical protein
MACHTTGIFCGRPTFAEFCGQDKSAKIAIAKYSYMHIDTLSYYNAIS